MAEYEAIKCRKCGAPITFAKTKNGKNLPIDHKGVRMWVKDTNGNWMQVWAHTTHFETCPYAEDFRGKGKPAEPAQPAPAEPAPSEPEDDNAPF